MSDEEASQKAEEHRQALEMLDRSLLRQGIGKKQKEAPLSIESSASEPEIIPPSTDNPFQSFSDQVESKRNSKIANFKNQGSELVSSFKKPVSKPQPKASSLHSFPNAKPGAAASSAKKFDPTKLMNEMEFEEKVQKASPEIAGEPSIDEKLLEIEKRIVLKLGGLFILCTGILAYFLR